MHIKHLYAVPPAEPGSGLPPPTQLKGSMTGARGINSACKGYSNEFMLSLREGRPGSSGLPELVMSGQVI